MITLLDYLAQAMILVCGVSAIWLVGSPRPQTARWGPLVGLAAQPGWLFTTIVNGQWAIAVMCLFYTAAWWRGVRTHWGQKADQ